MRSLKNRINSFLRDESGLILVESLIMLPMLIWALVAIFIYWDVFRTINMNQKAAYAVADLLSRQKTQISLAYANGLQNVVEFLTPGGHPVKLRITSFQYNDTTKKYELLFSFSPGSPANGILPVTAAELQTWKPRIPTLANLDSVFVVETAVDYKAKLPTALMGFLVGVNDTSFGQFIVTRPRHRRLCLEGTTTCN